MKAAERRHYAKLVVLGCIVCRSLGFDTIPEIHHPRAGTGMGLKAKWETAIPLCTDHHRVMDHPRTPSIHLDKLKFIEAFGTEAELLARVQALI